MQIQTFVKQSATIVRVTELEAGSIYKRLVKGSYASDPDKLMFGVVTDVLPNGDETVVTAMEFTPPLYSSGAVEQKMMVFSGASEVTLFPASVEEWKVNLAESIEKQQTEVDRLNDSLKAKSAILRQMVKAHSDPALLVTATSHVPAVAITENTVQS